MGLWEDMNNMVGAVGSTLGSVWGLMTNPAPEEDVSVILLAGVPLPGLVQAEAVSQSMDIEPVPIEGRSGTAKIIHGWTDATLRYSLRLCTDDEPAGLVEAFGQLASGDIAGAVGSATSMIDGDDVQTLKAIDRLSIMNTFAKSYDKDVNPRVWEITQELAGAHGVKQVIFTRFDSRRTSRMDWIDVDIEFVEFIPATALIETGAMPPADQPTPSPDTANPLEG